MVEVPWIKLASHEIDVSETDGKANKYFAELWPGKGFDCRKDAWCAAFVSWVLRHSIGEQFKSVAARGFQSYGINLLGELPYGCIVILARPGNVSWLGHIGFNVSSGTKSTLVTLLAGNQDNRVCIKSFPKDRIVRTLWPKNFQAMLPISKG